MGRLLVHHQEERFVSRTGLEKLNRQVAGDVGAVPLDRERVPRREELRVPVGTLARENHPAIEAGRVAAEVPLADDARVIAACLKPLDGVVAGTVEAVEDRHPVLV